MSDGPSTSWANWAWQACGEGRLVEVSEVRLQVFGLTARAERAEAERDRLREALIELIQQTHNCERELTEDLHHVDFCGESAPLTNARAALKGETP